MWRRSEPSNPKPKPGRRPEPLSVQPHIDDPVALLRYFQVAAPLHHADEALDLFPALQGLGDAELTRHALRLQAEHTELDAMWSALSVALSQVAQGEPWPDTGPDATPFAERHLAHAQAEETLLYPHATRLPADTLRQLADAMVARRSQP